MRPVFIAFALLLCTCVHAQSERSTVTETERENNYFFRVRLNEGRSSELMHCTNELTESNINVRMKGDLTLTVDDHSELTVITRSRTLDIEHRGSQAAERQRVKDLVARVKECLDLPETSATERI